MPDGTFAVSLSAATQESLEVVASKDLIADLDPMKEINTGALKAELREKGDSSDLAGVKEPIEKARVGDALVVFDPSRRHGAEFLLCLTDDAKFSFRQAEEEALLGLVEAAKKKPFEYKPPQPRERETLGSESAIEGAWVKNERSKIRLQVKRSAPRADDDKAEFTDRNVADAKDGLVFCESLPADVVFKKKSGAKTIWSHVAAMDRAVQAVPVVTEGQSQTELKHPKHVAIEYEARVFSNEEVAELWKSAEMRSFLEKAETIMGEFAATPDIMGELRPEVEAFYKRDEVVVVEETRLVPKTVLSDLVFTRGAVVTQAKWHPTMPGIVAVAVVENASREQYLDNLSRRIVAPNVVTVWSLKFPFFPQLLLRICDDVTSLDWHPFEPGTLVGGCANGQLVVWDISEYTTMLRKGDSTWDHNVLLSTQRDKLHLAEGFIPLLHWSAESDVDHSHLGSVETVQWLPQTVWFSHDSAYPKANTHAEEIQLISCDGDRYVLIWAMRRPPADSADDDKAPEAVDDSTSAASNASKRVKSTGAGWEKLKLQSALPASISSSASKKYSPAVGKYESLNKIWRPVHKICFLNPRPRRPGQDLDEMFHVLITSLIVIDRPDLAGVHTRKDSVVEATTSDTTTDLETKEEDEDEDEDGEKGVGSAIQAQSALPTFLLAGTIFGAIFRVDLTKVKVDVETNELSEFHRKSFDVHI